MALRNTLGALLLAASSTATAQTLTDAATSFQPGESFLLHFSAYIPPGNAGANVTWDLSSLTDDSTRTVSYVAPQGTPAGTSFPNSTVAQPSDAGDHTYFSCNAAGIELLGTTAGADLVIYQDGERILSYPCSFSTQWQDPFSASFTVQGIAIERSGTITGNADGFGSVVMPYGTVSNVLRVKTTETYADVTPFGDFDYDLESYYFHKPGLHVPVASVRDYVLTAFGMPQTIQSADWLDGSFVGIEAALRNDIGIDLFPNPARTDVSIVFGADGADGLRMEIMDAAGRVVMRQDLGRPVAGIQRHDLELGAFAPGLYNVHITDGRGGHGVKRLVIE